MGAGVNVLMYMHDSRMPACMWAREVYFYRDENLLYLSVCLRVCVCVWVCVCV